MMNVNYFPVKNALPSIKHFELKLLICQVLNLLCLVEQLSGWLIGYALVSLIWQFSIAFQIVSSPARLLKLIFSFSGVVILALSSLSMGLLLSMVHLLCLAYILKPLELKKQWDKQQIKLLNLFVLSAALIFQQSLVFAFFILVLLVVNITLFIDDFIPKISSKSYKLTAVIICQSLPMAVLLFFTFPKLSPLWKMPQAPSAQVGLSDSVKIGDIANLALSNELAFRVEFDNYQPRTNTMYWRTIVLEHFDGVSWHRRETIESRNSNPTNYSDAFRYSVFAEPSHQTWLYGLDLAWLRNGSKGKNLEDFTMVSTQKISNIFTYQVTSTPKEQLNTRLPASLRQLNLKLPLSSNPRLTEKGRQLRQGYTNDRLLVQAALTTFNSDDYRYTLKPPLLANNSLDQFYFETKAGFCEHYASSFTYLMRAAGIPARVVVGYLGGEFNRQGGYYSIYQRDAHAWSEVWLAGQGWQRVDPTAAVDISRIEHGLYGSLLQEQRELSGNLGWLRDLIGSQWLVDVSSIFDAIDYQWTKWIIGYSNVSQRQLLSRMFGNITTIKIALVVFVVITFSVLLLWFFNRIILGGNALPVQIRYMKKLHLLLNKGGKKVVNADTGQNIIEKAIKVNGKLHRPVEKFIFIYQQIEYAPNSRESKAKLIKQLKYQWREIKKA